MSGFSKFTPITVKLSPREQVMRRDWTQAFLCLAIGTAIVLFWWNTA